MLDRTLFIHTKDSRVFRCMQVKSNNGCRIRLEAGIIRGHVALQSCGFSSASLQTRAIRLLLTFIIEAVFRNDQCVDPSGGACLVRSSTLALSVAVSVFGG